ncbi:hypothetical protein [Nocardia camponoti]|uniref:Uncharacterized protein n=1 Tax=Nocardia camponoti TaxID=1616106 RepID=A0A917VEW8_9NOCA|nr:hypothetical protein [Nocardia camponoti]GGK68819.1 hypothetical protein GCM10011591_46190 [Nocardia camponoti]
MATFEDKYQAVLTYLRDNQPNLGQIAKVDTYLTETNAAFEAAELDPQRRLELIELRNEAMTAATSARRSAQQADQALRDEIAAALSIRKASPLTAARRISPSVATDNYTPPLQYPGHDRDRGISR